MMWELIDNGSCTTYPKWGLTLWRRVNWIAFLSSPESVRRRVLAIEPKAQQFV